MKILIVQNSILPASLYGGTERVIWALGKELSLLGHQISYLVKRGSQCPFAEIITIDESRSIISQIPKGFELVHFNAIPTELASLQLPYLITIHGNSNDFLPLDVNTVFVSKNHAQRYGSNSFVYNGLDWSDYPKPLLTTQKIHFHFLGKAAWRVKNVQGAIDLILKTKNEKLCVLGGNRFNFKMGLRFTFSPRIRFYGMVDNVQKASILNQSKGLIFPVKWHEPFGLALIESLFFGCPVFGTPYGALPEIIKKEYGFLSNQIDELTQAIQEINCYSPIQCHEYASEEFNSKKMAHTYLEKYEQILRGQNLNPEPPQLQQLQGSKFLEWN